MDLTAISDRVTKDLCKAISTDLGAEDTAALAAIVRKALLDVSGETHKAYKDVAVVCCGPEADLAHKIQERMDQERDMVITNLMALR